MSTARQDRRDHLRAAIARDEAALRAAVRDLGAATQPQYMVEQRIARRPAPWLVGAFALGLWLASGD